MCFYYCFFFGPWFLSALVQGLIIDWVPDNTNIQCLVFLLPPWTSLLVGFCPWMLVFGMLVWSGQLTNVLLGCIVVCPRWFTLFHAVDLFGLSLDWGGLSCVCLVAHVDFFCHPGFMSCMPHLHVVVNGQWWTPTSLFSERFLRASTASPGQSCCSCPPWLRISWLSDMRQMLKLPNHPSWQSTSLNSCWRSFTKWAMGMSDMAVCLFLQYTQRRHVDFG